MDVVGVAGALAVGACVFGCMWLGAAGGFAWLHVAAAWWVHKVQRVRAGPAQTSLLGGRGRREEVTSDMPAFLDVLTLGLGAGLSFDASLELYCARYNTPLSQELERCLLRWRMGLCGRAEALDDLACELEEPALTRFASTVGEALAFGAPLAMALEQQAHLIRAEQRALVEERIERVPVRLLIPLGTLIVPALLLAVLGPLLGPALGVT